MNKKYFCLFAAIIILFLSTKISPAQDREKAFQEQEIREALAETALAEKVDKNFLYDYGAWLRISPYRFGDPDQRRSMIVYDNRIWVKSTIKKHHEFYFRMKTLVVDYNNHASYIGDDEYLVKPKMDQGYYKIDLVNSLFDVKEARMIYPAVSLQLGRQYYLLGTGLIYNRVDDGANLELNYGNFESTILAAQSDKETEDIDRTRPGARHSRRHFVGIQLNYKELGRHQPYIIGLMQKDFNKEKPVDTFQNYRYDSNYFGAGVNGAIIPRLEYTAEFVNETGSSYGNSSTKDKDHIKANANVLQLRYLPEIFMKPVVTMRYLSGSGDGNRSSVTNTKGGNRKGTDDRNFLYFGYALTGYVVEPRISNLQVYNMTIAAKPIDNKEFMEDTEVGVSYYLYNKIKRKGAISDLNASRPRYDVGKEIDLYLNWKVMSDSTVSVKYGSFMPGAAYPNNLDRKITFFNINFTYSF